MSIDLHSYPLYVRPGTDTGYVDYLVFLTGDEPDGINVVVCLESEMSRDKYRVHCVAETVEKAINGAENYLAEQTGDDTFTAVKWGKE